MKGKLPTNSPPVKIPFGGLTSDLFRNIVIVLMISDHVWAKFMSFGDRMTCIGGTAFPI